MSSMGSIWWSPTSTRWSRSGWSAWACPCVGFHQHTDVETKRRAEAAGLALVVPRSRMVRELPELAERLLAG